MGRCKYCGKSAGLFRKEHPECKAEALQRKEKRADDLLAFVAQIKDCFARFGDFESLRPELDRLIDLYALSPDELEKIFSAAGSSGVYRYLEVGVLSEAQEEMVQKFNKFAGFTREYLMSSETFRLVVMSATLRDIIEGKYQTVDRLRYDASAMPVLLEPGEKMLWYFDPVECHQERLSRELRGSSIGMGVGDGIYYGLGTYSAHEIETSYMQKLGLGSIVLTDRNVYVVPHPRAAFSTITIPFYNISRVVDYPDAVTIDMRDGYTLPYYFKGVESWFF